jgi:hypothetical protein
MARPLTSMVEELVATVSAFQTKSSSSSIVPFGLVAFCYLRVLYAGLQPTPQETYLARTFLAPYNGQSFVCIRAAFHTAGARACRLVWRCERLNSPSEVELVQ